MHRPAVKEREPRITIHPKGAPPSRIFSSSTSSDSEPSCSTKYLKKLQIDRNIIETAAPKPNCFSVQYRIPGLSENGYDGDTDEVGDDDGDEGDDATIANLPNCSPSSSIPLNNYVLPESIPSHRFGGFLHVLSRSLYRSLARMATGLGLRHQQSAWYKNCWQSPGSKPKSVHLMDPSAPSLLAKLPPNPQNSESSTTM
ncbi:uncharacterized protein LOC122625134 [Drosophila teissieri]|uniref:uncharacterized protein LOC122625134 n=1 Tax=Drosophila teissieri TaxID=7243 RepID=UPI001CBA0FD5|nr:uncharacterized protein LOC122625134 [Drosophila teissieri]